jgi:ABC-type multidrug transport system ATPase subunit
MTEFAIWTENLTRGFGKVQAVDSLSLEVPAGVIFGFLGPNGAGKTTTIRLLLGLLDASRGKAKVLGFDTRKQADEIRQRTGALLEHPGLYERLSAEDNLDFYGRIWRMSSAERTARSVEGTASFAVQLARWLANSDHLVVRLWDCLSAAGRPRVGNVPSGTTYCTLAADLFDQRDGSGLLCG